MALFGAIIFLFLDIVAVFACIRAGKLVFKAIGSLFDKIEDRFC